MNIQFRFLVSPGEDLAAREARWDTAISDLQAGGMTVSGTGPDGDWPVRVEFPDGQTIDHTNHPIDGPFVEIYDTVPLVYDRRLSERMLAEEAHRG